MRTSQPRRCRMREASKGHDFQVGSVIDVRVCMTMGRMVVMTFSASYHTARRLSTSSPPWLDLLLPY